MLGIHLAAGLGSLNRDGARVPETLKPEKETFPQGIHFAY